YRLIRDLLWKYEQTARPRIDSSHVVNVLVRFSLQQIYDLDEKRQILTISGWLTAEWTDEYLVWDPQTYGNMTSIVLSPRKIWTPKMAIGNTATKMFQDWKHFLITVRHNGQCRWQPGGNFAFTCALDMNYYPFDEQSCTMELETWHYTADMVNLTNSMGVFGMETYLKHGEWAIEATEVKRKFRVYSYYESEAFPEVFFTIRMRRKYTFYFMYIMLPCIMLSFVLLLMFLLPAESGEKISLGVSILVSFSVFLLIVAEKVPDTSDAVPIMGKSIFLMYFMMATSLSVMSSTMIVKFHYGGMAKRPPKWLRVGAFNVIATALCLQHAKEFNRRHEKCRHLADGECKEKTTNGDVMPQSDSMTAALSRTLSLEYMAPASCNPKCSLRGSDFLNAEWKKISEVLDRLFFWLFFLFLLIPLASLVSFINRSKVETI
ncbi:hypothetical protein CAPTEDRAFT_137949, partial [Capitella teleta]